MNTLAVEQYPFLSVRFLKAYIITMRPYLMFVSGITGIVGMSFATELDLTNILLIFAASFFSYGFGQALTDCFQIDTDSISSPYRPLTQGIVNRNHFLLVSGLGLIGCILVLTYYNPLNLLLGILAGIGLVTYTYFKRKWWAGPFYNSWIVAILFTMAYLAGLGRVYFSFSNPLLITSIVTVFFGYANFVLTGYFKDIEADRETFYNTLPVVFGRKISAVVSDVFALLTSLPIFILILYLAFDSFPYQTILRTLPFVYGGLSAAIITQMNLHSVNSDDEAHKAISPCVHSYILLLSSLAALNKPDWSILLIAFYLLYLITMKLRPAREQI